MTPEGTRTADVVLDCRWLGVWGAGRVTQLLLRGLAEDAPDGRWVLWGGRAVEPLAWPGARVVLTDTSPRALFGQRSWLEVPRSALTVFMHQNRPLRPVPSITLIYDTIGLRYGASPAVLQARRFFLRKVAALSRTVVTISRYSAECIARDLHVPPDRVSVVPLPVDPEAAGRLRDRRRSTPPEDFALYVGWFAVHKNLPRLVAAFERTRFCAGGGRLVLAGGAADEVERVRAGLTTAQRRFVDVRGWCEQDELDRLMASARFLVQPSLEEGFGLPVLEALAGGLPVCVSQGGALPEVTRGLVPTFPPTSIEEMAGAIDRCWASTEDPQLTRRTAAAVLDGVPTVGEYARQFRQVVEKELVRW